MCVVDMKDALMSYIARNFRRILYYGLFGPLVLLLVLLAANDRNWKPLRGKPSWTATANHSKEGARLAIDRDLETWWSSYLAMTSGMYFQVDVGRRVTMNGILLQVGKERRGQPVSWDVKLSLDGERWFSPQFRKAFTLRSLLVIPFEAARAQYVHIVQTSIAATPSPWMIYELDVLQPVVPWQFERGTLMLLVAGWVLVILCVLLLKRPSAPVPPGEREKFWRPRMLIGVMAGVLLFGWLLRVYNLGAHEFSPHESQYFSVLSFQQLADDAWLNAYFNNSPTRPFWLTLLLIRLINGFCQDQLIASRFVPAVFSILIVLLMYLGWKSFSQVRWIDWEVIGTSALIGVAAWPVFLVRSGDFSSPLVLLCVLYLLTAYQLLYKRGSYWWILLLYLLWGCGISLHPMMWLVPFGVLVFGGFHLLLCKYSPGFLQAWHIQSYQLKHNLPRLVVFAVSLLPLYGSYWIFFLRQGKFFSLTSWEYLREFYHTELVSVLQSCGISGIMAWVFWGLVLAGIAHIQGERSHGEWWFLFQGCFFSFLLAVSSPEGKHASLVMLLMLLFLLCVRGMLAALAFLGPRLHHKERWEIRAAMLGGLTGYVAVFACNSLFWGSPVFPYHAKLYADQQSRSHAAELVRQIRQDRDECKQVAVLEPRVSQMYAEQYGLVTYLLQLSELQRWASQGTVYAYVLTSLSELETNETLRSFLAQYYTERGRSSQAALFQRQEQFQNIPRRYYALDLFFNTGHHVEDPQASKGLARFAKPEEQAGLLAFGPFCRVCRSGRYVARFALRAMEQPDEPPAILEVVPDAHGEPLARRELQGDDFVDTETYHTFDLPFELDLSEDLAYQMTRLQFFVHFTANAEVRLDYIEFIPGETE